MIEESKLAKSIRKGEEKRVGFKVYVYAFQITNQLSLKARKWYNDSCTTMRGATQTRSFHSTLFQSTPKAGSNVISGTVGESKVVTSELVSIIRETNDAELLEKLLNVNDQSLDLLKKVPGSGKPILTLQSLDIAFKNASPKDGKLDGTPPPHIEATVVKILRKLVVWKVLKTPKIGKRRNLNRKKSEDPY